jgi:hypothetical protein
MPGLPFQYLLICITCSSLAANVEPEIQLCSSFHALVRGDAFATGMNDNVSAHYRTSNAEYWY